MASALPPRFRNDRWRLRTTRRVAGGTALGHSLVLPLSALLPLTRSRQASRCPAPRPHPPPSAPPSPRTQPSLPWGSRGHSSDTIAVPQPLLVSPPRAASSAQETHRGRHPLQRRPTRRSASLLRTRNEQVQVLGQAFSRFNPTLAPAWLGEGRYGCFCTLLERGDQGTRGRDRFPPALKPCRAKGREAPGVVWFLMLKEQ